MIIVRQILFATVIALLSISLFVTFTQEAFLVPVSAKLLFWETAPIAVLWFLAGSFVLGLAIGALFALMLWLSMRKEIQSLKNPQPLTAPEEQFANKEQ